MAPTVSAAQVRRARGSLRTVAFAVVLIAVGLIAVAALLPAISPLRLDPVIFAVSVLVGAALSVGLFLIGRSPSLPNLVSVEKPKIQNY